MTQFYITYGVSGGYNDITHEVVELDNQQQADDYCYEAAVQVYQMYDIFYSQGDEDEIDAMSEEEREDAEREDMESWITYSAQVYVPEEHDKLIEYNS